MHELSKMNIVFVDIVPNMVNFSLYNMFKIDMIEYNSETNQSLRFSQLLVR